DDLRLADLLHAAIVRSPHAHARVLGVDARRALALPGVVAVLTIAELPECAAAVPPLVPSPRFRPYAQPAIASAKARYAGERAAIAAALGLADEQVRVIAPDVGGGFGAKGHVYPEDVLLAAVARRLGRPVKWIETRREHFLATAPDRDQRHRARLGVARDGT